MMHRDLKSPNVLLSEEGVAKIADVGMVRPQVQELVTAQPIMTPLWAAPEVTPLLNICTCPAFSSNANIAQLPATSVSTLSLSDDFEGSGQSAAWGCVLSAQYI